MDRLQFFFDEGMLQHSNGPHHPERAERLRRVVERLKAAELPHTQWREGREATGEEIRRAHEGRHVEWFLAQRGLQGRIDGDTAYTTGTVHAALLAAGGTIDAVDAVLDGETRCAWALNRPPGHHAERARAMGFCFVNHIAIAALHALEVRGLERIMIIDWDVHHGNGTEDIFRDSAQVLYFSTHQAPFFPGTGTARDMGEGAGQGFSVNLPMPAGTSGEDLRLLYRAFVPALMAAHQPELVLVSAGFDAHADDPLANFAMENEDFAALTRIVQDAADTVCDGRVVYVLEGGYDVDALANSVLVCARELTGDRHSTIRGRGPIGEKVLAAARKFHCPRWPIPPDA